MHFRCYYLLTFFILFLLGMGCSSKQENDPVFKDKSSGDINQYADASILTKQEFNEEIISNGKLYAVRRMEVRSVINSQISKVFVKNGDLVRKNQLLALLEDHEFKYALEKAIHQVKKTKIDFNDMLIAYSGGVADTSKIPDHAIDAAGIRSGYYSAMKEQKLAEYYLNATKLKAPFDGRIANFSKRDFESVTTNDIFCLLVDESAFEVEFPLTEFEIKKIKINDRVRVVPFSDTTYFFGQVSQINPIVDGSGLISVKAKVKGKGLLFDGMNVKVFVEKTYPNQLVVPKSAIVVRQNHEVLFKYSKGKAIWVYVRILNENSNQFSVVADMDKGSFLLENDTIIISNNVGLNHNSEVIIRTRDSSSLQ